MAIIKVGTVIDNAQRHILAACNLLLGQGDTILCTVTGPQIFARDLPQGGLDVPCRLSFARTLNELMIKIKKLLKPGVTDFKKPK